MNWRTLISTLWFLQSHSVANALRVRVRRLKQPKYLIGAVVGVGYFWMFAFRNLFSFGRASSQEQLSISPESQTLLEAGAAVLLVGFVALNWIVTADRASLRFSEAEIAFLLPAPLSRRSLIHFRLLRAQAGTLFSAFFFSLLAGRAMRDGHWLIHVAAWWLVLSTLNLHGIGASFAVQRLTERGLSGWRRRLLALAILAALVGAVVWWFQVAPAAEHLRGLDDFREFALGLLSAGPAPWLLAPFRWLVRPWFARDTLEFLRTVGPALLLLAAHYWWVIRSDVSFEEASIDASRRTAEKVAAVRSGNWQSANKPKKAKRAPFQLVPVGFPPLALLWKNLLGAGQMFTTRMWFILVWLVVVSVLMAQGFLHGHENAQPVLTIVVFFGLALLVMSVFLGPQMLRNDFRSDLPNMDLLKTMPLPGWQIALGQLLGPVAILTAMQWLLLVLVLGLSGGLDESLEDLSSAMPWRWPAAISAAMVLPFANFLLLALPNAAALVFPAWSQSAAGRGGGVEVMGQRLIFVFGQMLILALSLLPAALLGWLFWYLAQFVFGPQWALPVAALGVALSLAAECAAALYGLGVAFARFDLSAEQ